MAAKRYQKLSEFLASMPKNRKNLVTSKTKKGRSDLVAEANLSPKHKRLVQQGNLNKIGHALIDEHLENQDPTNPQPMSICLIC